MAKLFFYQLRKKSFVLNPFSDIRYFEKLIYYILYKILLLATGSTFNDAVHITAIVGESVVFNCQVEFPAEHPVPYVLQWEKKGLDIPIFIWYDNYPTHSGSGYEGRVARVSPDSPYGLASLNLTNIQESDQGWYACKVVSKGGKIVINSSISSQFLTALLMSTPLSKLDTHMIIKNQLVSKPYIDMTIKIMKDFGIKINHKNYCSYYISGNQNYCSPGEYYIEGDASSASYFLAASAIKGKVIKIIGINENSIQGDIKFINVIRNMGAKVYFKKKFIECQKGNLIGINIDANKIPDAAMTIAVMALFANNSTIIRNIYNWRVKETDRLSAMSYELKKIGAKINEGKDFIHITPPKYFLPSTINTYHDHRMAMCFSLISLSHQCVKIINPNCVSKTFPKYFKELNKISILNK